jgi:hypothetical protein
MSSCCTPGTNGMEATDQNTDCCSVLASDEQAQPTMSIRHCPVCDEKGKGVDTQTIKAMLDISLHEIRPRGYAFCRSEGCPVVYFSLDGEQTLAETDLRVSVHQKHPEADDVFVCYCFRHTPGSIRAELAETGQSTVVETVTRGTQTGQCACEIRNPQGNCCLGNVHAVVKRMMLELDPAST